jgi:starch phosphorylase
LAASGLALLGEQFADHRGLFGITGLNILCILNRMAERTPEKIAYFSMEIAVDERFPTYSGGLGVLAGDVLRAAADLELPMTGVTLVHRQGYFHQVLDPTGYQSHRPEFWQPEAVLEPVEPLISLSLHNRRLYVRAWRHWIFGVTGYRIPVYLLDTDLPENGGWERTFTNSLYGGDPRYRLYQEIVLGMGGVRILRAQGARRNVLFHMNEGHSALLTLALLEERLGRRNLASAAPEDIEAIRQQCVFTTHTPVPAAFDQFPLDMATEALGADRVAALEPMQGAAAGKLNMTYLGVRCSRYVNGVAMRHGEVAQRMFPNDVVHSITNGVHAATWTCPAFQDLYDRHIPEWRQDNRYIHNAIGISLAEIRKAHQIAKREMIKAVAEKTGVRLSENVFTLGFARRAATYKRADLIFSDVERLREVRRRGGPFQIVYGGKAHPGDEEGKAVIQRVFDAARALRDTIPVVYVENYDMRWARLLLGGVDLWVNNPRQPYEASGTSGMKAALNGVPSLSVLDGWWVEGCYEGVTGWAIGLEKNPGDPCVEMTSLYEKLEKQILPAYYDRRQLYVAVMRSAMALNGSFFSAQRMVEQYARNAYFVRTPAAEDQHDHIPAAQEASTD